jgi:hypothetical protein
MSLSIPTGWTVTLYDAENFAGRSTTLTRTDVCLSTWGRKATSLKIGGCKGERDGEGFFCDGRAVHMLHGSSQALVGFFGLWGCWLIVQQAGLLLGRDAVAACL